MSWSAEEELDRLRFDFRPLCLEEEDDWRYVDEVTEHPHVLGVAATQLCWLCVDSQGRVGRLIGEARFWGLPEAGPR